VDYTELRDDELMDGIGRRDLAAFETLYDR
jgi:hypothetical protein